MKEVSHHLDPKDLSHSTDALSKISVSAEEMQAFFKSEKSPSKTSSHAPHTLDMGTADDLYGKSEKTTVHQYADQQFDLGGAMQFAGRWAQAAGHRAASFISSPEQQAAFVQGQVRDQADFGRGVVAGAGHAVEGLLSIGAGAVHAQLNPVETINHVIDTGKKIAHIATHDPVGQAIAAVDNILSGAVEKAQGLAGMSRYQVGEIAGGAAVLNMIPGVGEIAGKVGATVAGIAERELAVGKAAEAAGAIAKRLKPAEEAKGIASEIVEAGKKGWEEVGKGDKPKVGEALTAQIKPEIDEAGSSFGPDFNWNEGKAMSMPQFEKWLGTSNDKVDIDEIMPPDYDIVHSV